MSLPECMYDYRHESKTIEIIGECHVCGEDISNCDDYRYRNDALVHEECLDYYEEED